MNYLNLFEEGTRLHPLLLSLNSMLVSPLLPCTSRHGVSLTHIIRVWQIASFSSHFASFTVGLAYFFFFGFILFVVILLLGICVIIRDKSSDYRHWTVGVEGGNECHLVITGCQKVRRALTVGMERHGAGLSTLLWWGFNAVLAGFQPCAAFLTGQRFFPS